MCVGKMNLYEILFQEKSAQKKEVIQSQISRDRKII